MIKKYKQYNEHLEVQDDHSKLESGFHFVPYKYNDKVVEVGNTEYTNTFSGYYMYLSEEECKILVDMKLLIFSGVYYRYIRINLQKIKDVVKINREVEKYNI